ncbi:hypothetical protein NS228_14460 [Methylobacterium indicum]|uniref:Uncharacterized protein n=1 Tax=Methylobacterium indicum TaxID=1775910 RepID=A0A0J6QRP9_9HYPH|nr:hypothetical protein [Methylobacterium indicum]KMO11807.1 hypothetical protein QR79_29355 [Methylobacterium indicum]KMO21075.1 hypothetical protein QR78_09445 [Methylobacterium indicum]KTS38243.1 hypothetical protein NS229_04200 [Methylobacterium indicum]KTS39696.1 hypothetical protein NS228_14460 [Methylobacterium indicum]KTS52023.1 hypothetical protein NS230_12090 [Methylobacterium indicum]
MRAARRPVRDSQTRHLTLARAELAAGQAFGFAEEGIAAAGAGLNRMAMTATGATLAVALAATLAWAF